MDIIFFHGNCPDGWCAAYICKKRYPEAELVPLNHGLDGAAIDALITSCENKDVLMVDYSLRTRQDNDELNRAAKSFRILDHHKTAQAVLEGADYATFDMKRSGAGLAWDYLFGTSGALGSTEWNPADPFRQMKPQERPWWVNYTEDQDLWNWKLEHSEEINAYLMVQPRTVELWDMIAIMEPEDALVLGRGVRSYIEYYTRSVLAEAQPGIFKLPELKLPLFVDGVATGEFIEAETDIRCAVLNIPYVGVSEAGNALCKAGYPLAVLWFERGDGQTQFSLRGDGSIDVSKIAQEFGGGGHHNAAGFQLSLTEGRTLVDKILGRNNATPVTHCS